MAYIVSVTGTKSAESKWFIDIHPEIVAQLRNWEYAQPGLVSIDVLYSTDTTISVIYEFENKESYDAYLIAKVENPDWQARQQYYNSIGLVVKIEILTV